MKFSIVPIKDVRSLSIIWPIPDLQPFYKVNVSRCFWFTILWKSVWICLYV